MEQIILTAQDKIKELNKIKTTLLHLSNHSEHTFTEGRGMTALGLGQANLFKKKKKKRSQVCFAC